MITAYIVKYALTQGILKVKGYISDTTLVVKEGYYTQYYHRKEWTTDPEEAMRTAEEKRNKKLISLVKQLDKIKQMTFEIPV